MAHGVSGAGYSGVNTAAKILNCKAAELIKRNDSQKLRIYDAEEHDTWPQWLNQKIEDKRRRFKDIQKVPVSSQLENVT